MRNCCIVPKFSQNGNIFVKMGELSPYLTKYSHFEKICENLSFSQDCCQRVGNSYKMDTESYVKLSVLGMRLCFTFLNHVFEK